MITTSILCFKNMVLFHTKTYEYKIGKIMQIAWLLLLVPCVIYGRLVRPCLNLESRGLILDLGVETVYRKALTVPRKFYKGLFLENQITFTEE